MRIHLLFLSVVMLGAIFASCAPDGAQRGKWTVGTTRGHSKKSSNGIVSVRTLEAYEGSDGRVNQGTAPIFVCRLFPSDYGGSLETFYLSCESSKFHTTVFVNEVSGRAPTSLSAEALRINRRTGQVTLSNGSKTTFYRGIEFSIFVDPESRITSIVAP